MKKQTIYVLFSMIMTAFLMLTITLSVPAQKINKVNLASFAEDTAALPHDFNDDYYLTNGVVSKVALGRRTGTDLLSVFGWSSNPAHNNVRVLVTLPAYGRDGEILFWTPLGELRENGFTDDEPGAEARKTAELFPIYVFPRSSDPQLFAFTNVRQAAIIDQYQKVYAPVAYGNPLGLRTILSVDFTEKAFNTKIGIFMMDSMAKKNGHALDGTPLIKSRADLDELEKYELIDIRKRGFWDDTPAGGTFAIGPVIEDPTNQAIAADAFLLMTTQDGKPLASESEFARQFSCLQKIGQWCKE